MINWLLGLPRYLGCRLHDFIHRYTFIGVATLVAGLVANPADGQELTPDIAGETFDQVWNQVEAQYFDYERIAVDWEQARNDLRPEALKAGSQAELRAILNGLLERVGESHFGIMSGDSMERIDNVGGSSAPQVSRTQSTASGLSLRLFDQQLIVSRVQDTAPHAIQPGWELIQINDDLIAPLLDSIDDIDEPLSRERSALMLEAAVNSRLGFLTEGEVIQLTFLDAEGQTHQADIEGTVSNVETIRLGNLPPMAFQFRTHRIDIADDCVGVIEFSTWVPDLLERFLAVRDELMSCRGMIIDLRGNLGGVLTTMVPLAAHLISEPVLLGSLIRSDGQIDFHAFPRRVADDGTRIGPFDGHLAILIDGLSASTSEMFASGMQAAGLARVFGQKSPGMALPAQMLPLANGDRLMYAFADYTDGQGRRIEGVGVTPDETVHPDRQTLSTGQDPVIETAVSWIVNQEEPQS